MDLSKDTYDVAVFGSRWSGVGVAFCAAQAGLKTILVERRPVLGWESSWGFQLDWAEPRSGLGKEITERLQLVGGLKNGRVDAPILELVLDRMASEKRVDVLYYVQPVALSASNGRANGVIVAGKSGEIGVRARMIVDATERGLLWNLAGTKRRGEPPDGRFSIFFNNVDDAPTNQISLDGVAGIVVKPSLWPGEVVAEFSVPSCDVAEARRRLPGVLRVVRDEIDALKDALVTVVSVEPYPTSCEGTAVEGSPWHPRLTNLVAADFGLDKREAPSPLDYLAAAEKVAGEIARRHRDFPAPDAVDLEPSMTRPPIRESEVVVCGGGTAGAFAGIAAGRQGAKTTLIEATTFLGGIGTGGGIHMYYHGVKGGIQDEADERLESMTELFAPQKDFFGFHPEAKKVVLQQMSEEAGVELVFHTLLTGVETEDVPSSLPARGDESSARRLRGVVTAGPDGSVLYRAKAFVDSTGDGDVAVMAGAPYTFGRETDHLPHAYSQPAGRLQEKKLMVTNFDAGYCDPTDPVDLTRARRRGVQIYWQDHFTPDTRLLYIAPLIGLRNSRQIVGDYTLTFFDEIVGRDFPDVIAYSFSHFDNHGFDYENESDEAMLWVWTLGNWRRQIGCEIPYRCLLPQRVEGLLVACRAISITHDAHNQLRMQRDMQRLGEAAGVAAALAAKEGTTPRSLDVRKVQEVLFALGALGKPRRPELPAATGISDVKTLHDDSWEPPRFPARPVNEWAKELGGENSRDAVWALVTSGKEALPHLREALKSDDPDRRLWAAVALAMFNEADAVPELIRCVETRESKLEKAGRREPRFKLVPLWHSAIVLLGRIGDARAVPTLSAILKEKDLALDVAIAAIRALGRIGDPSGIEAVEEVLQRKDLNTNRELQMSVGFANPVYLDCRWQLDLAAAEALARMGRVRRDLVKKHEQDPRAYVRRYAAKVKAVLERK